MEGAWCEGASMRPVCIECREGGGVCLDLWLGITGGPIKGIVRYSKEFEFYSG